MTTITATRAINMAAWDLNGIDSGIVSTHNATKFVVTAPDGTVYTFTGSGFGSFDASNVPHAGNITKLVVTDPSGALTISSFTMDVNTFYGFVHANNGLGFETLLMAGNDTLTGTTFDDVLLGFAGTDKFILDTGGNDTVQGGDGNDTINMGGSLAIGDKIDGGTGSDTVALNGDYSAILQLAADTITNVEKITLAAGHIYNLRLADGNIAAGQTLTVDGSALGGSDRLLFRAIQETDGIVAATGGNGDDDLRGGAGADKLTGGGGNDALRGNAGNDKLTGNDGDDYLNGGAGKDSFDGGNGNDRVSFFDLTATQAVVADLRTQTITNDGFGKAETMVSIEGLGGGTVFADKLYGNDVNNFMVGDTADTLMGFAGNDHFQIGGAPGVVDGGDGTDGIDLFTASRVVNLGSGAYTQYSYAGVYVNLATNMIVNDSFGGSGHIYNIENLNGSYYDDTLIGNTLNNVLDGLDGRDRLYGGAGNDTIHGSAGYDTLRGQLGNDKLYGDDGDDYLNGGAGTDKFDGGAGTDRVSFFDTTATQGVVADLRTQSISNDGFGKAETMTSIESLGAGTQFVDKFYGNNLDNGLIVDHGDSAFGFGGNDHFQVSGAPLVIDGGDGVDGIDLFTSSRFINLGAGAYTQYAHAGVYVNLGAGMIYNDGFGNSGQALNIENAYGSYYNDTIVGSGVDNVLGGLDGSDGLYGGGGNDTLHGGAGVDFLRGNAGDDALDGGDDDDYLNGGAGVDSFDGGAGKDRISLFNLAATQGVVANLATQTISNDGFGNAETFVNIEGIGTASRFADILIGDDNDNFITGGQNDTITGAGGNDMFQLSGAPTTLDGGDGNDSITDFGRFIYDDTNSDGVAEEISTNQGVIIDLGAGVIIDDGFGNSGIIISIENVAGDANADELTGSAGDNLLAGGGNSDVLNGDDGNDLLYGDGGYTGNNVNPLNSIAQQGSGDDVLTGGHGNDLLDGGDGSDTANYDDLDGAVAVDLSIQGSAQDTGVFGGMDTLKSIENVTGTDFDDTLRGSSGNNVIDGGAGHDVIILDNGGDDTAFGGDGADEFDIGGPLSAGDHIDGGDSPGDPNTGGTGPGDVIVFYGPAQTVVLTDDMITDIEVLYFYPGFLPAGHWSLTLAEGNVGVDQHITLSCGDVTNAAVTFTFDASAETDGNTYLIGGAGDDTLIGGKWYTFLNGGLGNDTMTASGGMTFVSYGVGHDATGPSGGVTVSLAIQGIAQDTIGQGIDTLTGIQNLSGSQYDDHLTGDDQDNVLSTNGGNDTLNGAGGNDLLALCQGDNTADGGGGSDMASWMGLGFDANRAVVSKVTGGVNVSLLLQDTTQNTGQGNVVLSNIEGLEGTHYADTLIGDNGENTLYGAEGNDILVGNGGNDAIYGDRVVSWTDPLHHTDASGDDKINGGKGNDFIVGGGGADTLVGGADADIFAYGAVSESNASAIDRITDFTKGSDHIQLWFTVTGTDASVSTDRLSHLGSAADAGHLAVHHALLANVGGTNYLVVDANGVAGYQAGADLLIRLDGVATISTSDFAVT
jgi:Ca2+-binding RTX toxin-like protein